MNFDVKLDPQTQLVESWKRWLAFALKDDDTPEGPLWGDIETPGGNSVADAEMIEVLLLIGSQGDSLDLSFILGARPGTEHILDELRSELGFDKEDSYSSVRKRLFSILIYRLRAYFSRHLDSSDPPRQVFSAPGYLALSETSSDPNHDLETLSLSDMVDGFSMAISVCVQTLRLLRNLRVDGQLATVASETAESDLESLESMASARLTAAMDGLCDSFSVVSFNTDEWETSLRLNKDSAEVDFAAFGELDSLRRSVNLTTGAELPNDQPWECGFSWGRIHNLDHNHGVPALNAPYLYSTIVALDGITDVIDPAVIASGLLTDEQAALAAKLSFFAELTRRYWSILAFMDLSDGARWRLEDTPWRSPDADESIYLSLSVLRIITQSANTETLTGETIDRMVGVVEDLGIRSRVTRAPFKRNADTGDPDPALTVHSPGRTMELIGEGQDRTLSATLRVYDFVPQYIKVAAALASAAQTDDQRRRLRTVIESAYRHLNRRRFMEPSHAPGSAWAVWPPRGLWDDLARPPAESPSDADIDSYLGVPSWYFTERAVEALIALNSLRISRPDTPLTDKLVDEAVGEYEWSISQARPGARRSRILALDKSLRSIEAAGSFGGLAQLLNELSEDIQPDSR